VRELDGLTEEKTAIVGGGLEDCDVREEVLALMLEHVDGPRK
jgi:hypothetical protein